MLNHHLTQSPAKMALKRIMLLKLVPSFLLPIIVLTLISFLCRHSSHDLVSEAYSPYSARSIDSAYPASYGSAASEDAAVSSLNRILLSSSPQLDVAAVAALAEAADNEVRESSLEAPLHDEIYILEDKDYPKSLFERYPGVGQVSGITTLPTADVVIFHRADREWTAKTSTDTNRSEGTGQFGRPDLAGQQDNLIKNDTIMILDGKHGGSLLAFGSNLLSMPHSVASDNLGNLWVSDVARHQVMRLPTSMMRLNDIKNRNSTTNGHDLIGAKRLWFPGNLTRLWPDIILGEAFVSGADKSHFCNPSEIAVSSNGRLVFVADGYCNQRVMVFTGSGKFITSFGEQLGLDVVHSITLMEERNLVCVADRENGRILCFRAGLNGDLENIGELILTINYPLGKVIAIAALTPDHMLVSSNQFGTNKFDLATLNPFTKELKQTWTSSDLLAPHSLARTRDGLYVYATDVSKDAYKKVFKFNIIRRKN